VNKKAAALTIAVHLCAAIMFFPPSCTEPPPPPKAKPKEIVQEPHEVVFVAINPLGSGSCYAYYVGIGLSHTGEGRIWDVAIGGPADAAFVRQGDIMVEYDMPIRDQFTEGTVLTLHFKRGSITMQKKITVGRVCYDRG